MQLMLGIHEFPGDDEARVREAYPKALVVDWLRGSPASPWNPTLRNPVDRVQRGRDLLRRKDSGRTSR
jgi:hypothetical protein